MRQGAKVHHLSLVGQTLATDPTPLHAPLQSLQRIQHLCKHLRNGSKYLGDSTYSTSCQIFLLNIPSIFEYFKYSKTALCVVDYCCVCLFHAVVWRFLFIVVCCFCWQWHVIGSSPKSMACGQPQQTSIGK